MTQFNNELYAGFLPEAGDARFEGKRGFYPAMTAEEYRALPLPMKCATWDARVQYVISIAISEITSFPEKSRFTPKTHSKRFSATAKPTRSYTAFAPSAFLTEHASRRSGFKTAFRAHSEL